MSHAKLSKLLADVESLKQTSATNTSDELDWQLQHVVEHRRLLGSTRLLKVGLALIALALTALTVAPRVVFHSCQRSDQVDSSLQNGGQLMSNGTHLFNRTVIIISIDGMR